MIFLDSKNTETLSKTPLEDLEKRIKNSDQEYLSGRSEFSDVFSDKFYESIPDNSVIFLISDGDFRSNRDRAIIPNDLTIFQDKKGKILTTLQAHKNISVNFLLLCSDRLELPSEGETEGKENLFLQYWNDIKNEENANVYGMDCDTAASESENGQKEMIEFLCKEISILLKNSVSGANLHFEGDSGWYSKGGSTNDSYSRQ